VGAQGDRSGRRRLRVALVVLVDRQRDHGLVQLVELERVRFRAGGRGWLGDA
jgi:hypothetical protein